MTRYWVDNNGLFPYQEKGFVQVILTSDLPAHDAQLRAQVWEEAARIVEANTIDCGDSYDDAIFYKCRELAAALRQRGWKG